MGMGQKYMNTLQLTEGGRGGVGEGEKRNLNSLLTTEKKLEGNYNVIICPVWSYLYLYVNESNRTILK